MLLKLEVKDIFSFLYRKNIPTNMLIARPIVFAKMLPNDKLYPIRYMVSISGISKTTLTNNPDNMIIKLFLLLLMLKFNSNINLKRTIVNNNGRSPNIILTSMLNINLQIGPDIIDIVVITDKVVLKRLFNKLLILMFTLAFFILIFSFNAFKSV